MSQQPLKFVARIQSSSCSLYQASDHGAIQTKNVFAQFDRVYTDPAPIFKQEVTPIVNSRRSALILVVGPSGSGKSYTLLGLNELPGIINQTAKLLFEMHSTLKIAACDLRPTTTLQPYDLYKKSFLQSCCTIKTVEKSLTWRNCTISTFDHILLEAISKRPVARTVLNKGSSRSHLFIFLQTSNQNIIFADFAGSEPKNSGNNEKQKNEALWINKTLAGFTDLVVCLNEQKRLPNAKEALSKFMKDAMQDQNLQKLFLTHLSQNAQCRGSNDVALRFSKSMKTLNKTSLNPHTLEGDTQLPSFQETQLPSFQETQLPSFQETQLPSLCHPEHGTELSTDAFSPQFLEMVNKYIF